MDGEDLKIWYRKSTNDGGKGLYEFYYEKCINSPVLNILLIMGECQMFKDWVPTVYDTDYKYRTSEFMNFG